MQEATLSDSYLNIRLINILTSVLIKLHLDPTIRFIQVWKVNAFFLSLVSVTFHTIVAIVPNLQVHTISDMQDCEVAHNL